MSKEIDDEFDEGELVFIQEADPKKETLVLPPGLIVQAEFLEMFKGAVLGEYMFDDDGKSKLTLLIRKNDTYEWMDVTKCIPSDSDRNYVTLSTAK